MNSPGRGAVLGVSCQICRSWRPGSVAWPTEPPTRAGAAAVWIDAAFAPAATRLT